MRTVRFSTWKLEAKKRHMGRRSFSKTAEEMIQQIFKEDLSDKSILKTAKMTNQIRAKNTRTLGMQTNKNMLVLKNAQFDLKIL